MTTTPLARSARADEARDAGTADELIVENMPLVTYIVRETMGRVPAHVNRDDLHSAGLTALVKAGQAYQAERGVPFARYAAGRIRGAILDELRQVDWASRSVRRRGRELDEARTRLTSTLGRRPDNTEVANSLGLTLAEVQGNVDDVARAQVLSLQGSTENPYEETLISATPLPEDLVEHRERLQYLVEAIAELPERMRTVVQEYFIAERPMAEIGASLGVTESRVSQIRAEALVLLRHALNSALDPDLVSSEARPTGCAAQRRASYVSAVATRHAAGRRPVAAPRRDTA